jgi:hypothetical protein
MEESFQEQYGYIFQETKTEEERKEVLDDLPYERISLEHEPSWWASGSSITYFKDRRAELEEEGTRKGRIHLFDYGRLCFLIDRLGFRSFKPKYEWDGFDGGRIVVKVWPTGSEEPIVVEEYGCAGPYELWMIQQAIQGLVRNVLWKKEGA